MLMTGIIQNIIFHLCARLSLSRIADGTGAKLESGKKCDEKLTITSTCLWNYYLILLAA